LWGARARRLREALGNAASVHECAALLAEHVSECAPRSPVQKAIGFLEKQAGRVSLDDLARQAGMSARQFRRVCLRETGLSPKFLARVLRFRRALTRVPIEAGDHAGLAAECGYTDQSHFIAEFREFSGNTPAGFLKSRT
jgi:transcriptional regulator GlxA family with amidase domain